MPYLAYKHCGIEKAAYFKHHTQEEDAVRLAVGSLNLDHLLCDYCSSPLMREQTGYLFTFTSVALSNIPSPYENTYFLTGSTQIDVFEGSKK